MGFTANIVAFASMWFVFVDASSSLQNCEFEPGSIRRINSYVFQVKEKSLVLRVVRVAGFSRDARLPIG